MLRPVAYLSKFKSFWLRKLDNIFCTLTNIDLDTVRNDSCRFDPVISFPFLFNYISGKSVLREHRNTFYSLKKLAS